MTHVVSGLYWCGCHEVQELNTFDIVVDTIGVCKNQPVLLTCNEKQIRITWTFPDTTKVPDEAALTSLGEYLYRCIFVDHKRVLVFCAAGWNRSGLVVASILKNTEIVAYPGLVNYLKQLRPRALNNLVFENYVRNLRTGRL